MRYLQIFLFEIEFLVDLDDTVGLFISHLRLFPQFYTKSGLENMLIIDIRDCFNMDSYKK